MWDFFVDYVFGWYGLAGVAIIACIVLAILFPQFRLWLGAAALGIFGVMSAIGVGERRRAKIEQRRKDEAVAEANKKYDEIERRPDDVDHVRGRLTRGDF
jgi:hypothetical protein